MGSRSLIVVGLASCAVGCSGDDTVAAAPDAASDATLADAGADAHADAVADAEGDAKDANAEAEGDALADVDATPPPRCASAGYPAGPYGTAVGSVLAELGFDGLTDANGNGTVSDDPPTTICLGTYRLDPNVKAVVVHWTAAWCPPCQTEEPGFVQLAKQNAGKVAFVEAMAQNVGGQPATITSIVGWGSKYKIPFDLAIDPTASLAPYFAFADASVAFPAHMVVRADTMTIAFADVGAALDAGDLQSEIDAVVARADAGGD